MPHIGSYEVTVRLDRERYRRLKSYGDGQDRAPLLDHFDQAFEAHHRLGVEIVRNPRQNFRYVCGS